MSCAAAIDLGIARVIYLCIKLHSKRIRAIWGDVDKEVSMPLQAIIPGMAAIKQMLPWCLNSSLPSPRPLSFFKCLWWSYPAPM